MTARRIREIFRDRRGGAAIEFALIAPVAFGLHLAATDFVEAFQAQRRVAHAAATIADLTAQGRTVSTDELNDIFAAGRLMIYPFDTGKLGLRLSSISANGSGSRSVDWQASDNYTATGGPSVPAGYLAANESVVVADVTYDYQPIFGAFTTTTIAFTRHAYLRPRLSDKVTRS